MDIQKEKLFLRRIAASWGKQRNFGNLDSDEVSIFLLLQELKLVDIKDDKGSSWIFLTNDGLDRLYELNGIRDT